MRDPSWPLLDLCLRVGDLLLRPPDEVEQAALALLVPDDLELDPSAPRLAGRTERDARVLVMRQTFWRHLGSWTAGSWQLHFAVRRDGRFVGEQVLEGEDFPALRTVDSSSWLVPEMRGQGLGTRMRRAVLALAFGPLRARVAVSSAWHDNHASLGVSRALGYRPNGENLHVRDDGVDTMTHLRLTRADWLAAGSAAGVVIENVEPCLPLFGLR